jgi:tetratricopeptide (TPR) repeat protein
MKTLIAVALLVSGDFSTTIAALETAWMNDDVPAIRKAVEDLKALPDTPRTQYAIAYGERRLIWIPGTKPADQKALAQSAQKRLEAVIRAEPRNAEAHALLASTLGMQIALEGWKGMVLGPRSSAAMDKALSLEPNNPRILLLKGISTFRMPAEFGGGVEKAEPWLRRAQSVFAQEPLDKPWPNWGRFESRIWLGQVLAKLGKRDAARSEYDAALLLAPRSQYVRRILLPGVSK